MANHSVDVTNLITEMRNTQKKDPADLSNKTMIPVPGRTIIINTDILNGLLLIDPLGNPFQAALNDLTTHILWSLVGGNLWFTIDGSDPGASSGTTSRHELKATNLGTAWVRDAVEQIRFAIKDDAPVFVYSEVSKR